MSSDHFECESTGSTLRPMILTLRLSNSGLSLAMYPSSVVQTGVKSLGCEKSTPHELPSQSWKRIGPSVVVASKSGASVPIASGPVMVVASVPDICPPGRNPSLSTYAQSGGKHRHVAGATGPTGSAAGGFPVL